MERMTAVLAQVLPLSAQVDVNRWVSRIQSEIQGLDTPTFITVGAVLVLVLAVVVHRAVGMK